MLFVIMNEHASQPIDYATVPGAWNFRHFNDSSRQLVHPTLLEFGLDELVQLQTTSVVGRADAEGGQRRSCYGHRRFLPKDGLTKGRLHQDESRVVTGSSSF